MQRYFQPADVSVRRHRWTEVDEADQARADSALLVSWLLVGLGTLARTFVAGYLDERPAEMRRTAGGLDVG